MSSGDRLWRRAVLSLPTPAAQASPAGGPLDLFVDRHDIIKVFAAHLHERPPGHVLHVTGEGGLGKSLLLRYLRERCCHRVDEAYWSKLRKERGVAFSTGFIRAATADPVPAAHLDFSLPPTFRPPTSGSRGRAGRASTRTGPRAWSAFPPLRLRLSNLP